ncbi:hypothetical protein FOA52_014693 [Chlamydomonas sp. UWO 241]|nr:hypothetical protein FOA52_014693 [Chlamydomonas sp. UWO 241]
MCEKCYKKRTGGHTLLKCGTCGAHYCSKECQRLDWKDHKHHCKQNHSAKALMDAAEPAELVAAFAKWMKKMRILLTRAATAALYLPTSRIATHALMLSLAHLPSMPLQFKVEAFDVWTRDKLFTLFKDDMPELPCWSLPGPDRRALVLVQMDKMLNLMPCFTDAETVADIQSGREQMEPLGRYIHFMNDRETQAVLRNNAELPLMLERAPAARRAGEARHRRARLRREAGARGPGAAGAPTERLSAGRRTPDGGQADTAGRAPGAYDASSSGTAGPSEAPHLTNFDMAQCGNCCKMRRHGHKLFSCSGCKSVYYCSKECQNESWRNRGHKQVCKQKQAAKAMMAEAGQAELFAAFEKWLKKMPVFYSAAAVSALLDVGTSRIATHALLLDLDDVPSMFLKFKADTAGRAPSTDEPWSSGGRAGPSTSRSAYLATTMCQNCGKKRSDGHHLLNCGGCNNAHCCSKECQDQSWRDGHKQVCKQYQAAKAAQSEGEHAEAFAAYAEWSNKTKRMLISAATSALWVPTLRLATHALVLLLDYLPSLPLKFQVRGFQVVSKAVLEVDLGLSLELPRINRPGTDRRALVLIMMSVPDMMSAPPSTGDVADEDATPSCWSVRQLRDELTRLGIDARGCVEKRELVDLVVEHQHSASAAASSVPDGGQAGEAGHRLPTAPSGTRPRPRFKTAQSCAPTAKLFSCSGCKFAHYCCKECQNESWQNGGHKQFCKGQQAAKAFIAGAGHANMYGLLEKWAKKMSLLLSITASSVLLVPTPRIATHALVLRMDHVPSMPLKLKVRTFEVMTKAELCANFESERGLPLLPPWNPPGPDLRAQLMIVVGRLVQLMPFMVSSEVAAEIQSGRRQMLPTKDYIDRLNDPEFQRKIKNKEDTS